MNRILIAEDEPHIVRFRPCHPSRRVPLVSLVVVLRSAVACSTSECRPWSCLSRPKPRVLCSTCVMEVTSFPSHLSSFHPRRRGWDHHETRMRDISAWPAAGSANHGRDPRYFR